MSEVVCSFLQREGFEEARASSELVVEAGADDLSAVVRPGEPDRNEDPGGDRPGLAGVVVEIVVEIL
jgi:hypothetical protein